MKMKKKTRVLARPFYATSVLVTTAFMASPVAARCINSGGSVTCDTNAPNPEPNGATGSSITILSGAQVQLMDPFAGGSPRSDTVIVSANGQLTAQADSQVFDPVTGGNGVNTSGNAVISLSGKISAIHDNARGVTLGQGSSIVVNADGIVETTGNGSSFSLQNSSAGIAASGSGTAITVNGVVRTSGSNAAAIRPASNSIFGPAFYATTLTVGSTGQIVTTGSNSTAVALTAGSTLAVTGLVSSTGAGSSAITYNTGPGPSASVAVAAGGVVQASQAPAIVNQIGGVLTITNAGTISSMAGPAIVSSGKTSLDNVGTITAGMGSVAVQLGSADDSVTLRGGSVVNGDIVGGGGRDSATLAGAGTSPVSTQVLAHFTGFDSLTVANGYWTASGTSSSAFNSVTIAGGSAFEVVNGTNGITGIATPSIVDNGSFVIRSSASSSGSTLGAASITGSGNVLLTGAGIVTLDGINSIATSGTITVDDGSTMLVTGSQGGNVVTSAGATLQIGNGATTGTFAGNLVDNGVLTVNRSDDVTFAGALSGSGTLTKLGAGTLTFGANYAFTGTTTIAAGSIRISAAMAPTTRIDLEGAGQLDLSGTQQTIAQLAGASSAASINIANAVLTVNQAGSTSFAGHIDGSGSVIKAGAGSLNLTGANTYRGATTVNGGRLAVNGSIASAITVNDGGRLGGTGAIGGATIMSGGVYAPGNSIGTQIVNGNVAFTPGAIYEVEADSTGASDRIAATGTATVTGGTVSVLAQAGTYNLATNYRILTSTGGVTGKFASVTSNLAFLTPTLSYAADQVTLTLTRNDISFNAVAVTPNQIRVANAVQALGTGNPVYNAILFQAVADSPAAFDALSGEIYADVLSLLIDSGRRVRDAVLDRAVTAGDGIGIWTQLMRNTARTEARVGITATNTDRKGVLAGIDAGRDGWRFGIHAGYIDANIGAPRRASHVDAGSTIVGAYARWADGPFAVHAGGDYTWHNIDARRAVSVAGLNGEQTAHYDAHTEQLFGEFSYRLIDGPFTAAPFGGIAYVRTHSGGLAEGGSAAALVVGSSTQVAEFLTIGMQSGGSAPISAKATLRPRLRIFYERGFGDLDGGVQASFGGAGPTFDVAGARLARNSFNLDGGLDIAFDNDLRIGIGAFGSAARNSSGLGGNISASFSF